MPSFTNLLIVMAVAFSAPLVLGLFPRLQLPSVVLEIVPVLKDAGEISSTFGQLIVAAASIADFGAIILLSIFFSGEGGTGSTLLLIVSLVDRDRVMTHPDFRRKLEAVGFGFFIPVFFVTSGVRFDLDALTSSASNLAMVPVFLAALLVVRGLPALVYRRVLDGSHTAIAGIMQATSLPFIVAATAIGAQLGLIYA